METTQRFACCRSSGVKFVVSLFCVCYLFYVVDIWASPKLIENIVIQGQIKDSSMKTTCDRLLSDARLTKADKPWFYVKGCEMHNYSQSDAQTCMHKVSRKYGVNSIALVGDSRIRNLFAALTKILGKKDWRIPIPMRHADFHYYNPDIETLVFLRFRGKMDGEIFNDYTTWEESPAILRPRVIIQGNALWDLVYGGPYTESSRNFKANLSAILPHMTKVSTTTDILWMLQDPTDKRKMDETNIDIKGPQRVDAYNKMAVKLLSSTPVKLWSSARKVAVRFPNDSDAGGIHYGPRVIHYKIQLFLNWYCNRHMDFQDGTCCRSPDVLRSIFISSEQPFLPTATVTFVLSCFVLALLFRVLCVRSKPVQDEEDTFKIKPEDHAQC